ncbi:MAG: FG-GAP repeat protein, partial [Anaerolineae bacterium]|nr:FG-GAP repeat protein [Anaerolineae bacterium]
AADFNGDGYADLAVGVPSEDLGSLINAGAVHVLFGTASGLGAAGSQLWHQDIGGMADSAEVNDQFGYALGASDFNGDGYADLAVGIPFEGVGNVAGAGAVHVLYGNADGLSAAGNQFWHQDSLGIGDAAEGQDFFGLAVTTGDFDGDGSGDLVVAAPYEDLGALEDAGAAHVLYGGTEGLSTSGEQLWHQDVDGVAGAAEMGDFLGLALSAADFNGDGYADLAVGVPSEAIGPLDAAGAVNVLSGSAAGLSAAGDQLWHQDVGTVAGSAEAGDLFGRALAADDFNGDGYADLAIGAPLEDDEQPGISSVGAVHVLYGSTGGLADTGNQLWQQSSPGISDEPETGDFFGMVLAALPPASNGRDLYLPFLARE